MLLLTALLTSLALAADPVVAIGDGLVAAPPGAQTAAVGTSWVASLADCLEERSGGRFQVVDRVASGETVRSARERVAKVQELRPTMVIVGLGARELGGARPDSNRFRRDLGKLVRELRSAEAPPEVVLVGMVPPTLHQADVEQDQRLSDTLATTWNRAMAEVAVAEGARHVDLWESWPHDESERAALTTGAWELSDQGHARVAAAVCDVVVSSGARVARVEDREAALRKASSDEATDEEASAGAAAAPSGSR